MVLYSQKILIYSGYIRQMAVVCISSEKIECEKTKPNYDVIASIKQLRGKHIIIPSLLKNTEKSCKRQFIQLLLRIQI